MPVGGDPDIPPAGPRIEPAEVPPTEERATADTRAQPDSFPQTQLTAAHTSTPSTSIGAYELLEKIGEGGMGAVYKARHVHLKKLVALKLLSNRITHVFGAVDRFRREVEAVGRLEHPKLVRATDAGVTHEGVPYLVMELLNGRDLGRLVAERGPWPIAEACDAIRQAAQGLHHAHQCGIVHRDIKPSNLMRLSDGTVKVLDLGLARLQEGPGDSGLTGPGQTMGTADYMAPEQMLDSASVDLRADLYSLGCTLYQFLAGEPPFSGPAHRTLADKRRAHLLEPVPDLRLRRPDVPPALADLVGRLLAKNPADRPASAQEVCETLRDIEATLPAPAGAAEVPRATTVPPPPATTTVRSASSAGTRWRFRFLSIAVALSFVAAAGAVAAWFLYRPAGRPELAAVVPSGPPIRIGILHSKTGTMAISERPVIDAALLAVEEVNQAGGLLGRPVEAVVADGQSEEAVFARQAERLMREDGVVALFGCWTSASRKAVVPVVERHDHLLFYPLQYEGLEESPNVVYGGPVPNQQLIPALDWLVGFEGRRRWFLVGSDYVFPVTANAIVRDEAKARGCEVVGETYLLLGSTEVAGVVKMIRDAKPDLIVNTINGDTNVAFFRALRRAGVTSKATPTLSAKISEGELDSLEPAEVAGDYVAAAYFASLDTPQNKDFLRRFARRYGEGRPVSAAMEAEYTNVLLWAKAARAANSADPRAVRVAIAGMSFDAPRGLIRVDPATLHTVQTARVAQLDGSGRLVQVYLSPRPVVPEPFPPSRTRANWESFLQELYKRWGGRWSNAGP
jgi:urea transport system substrate-binding protein